MSVQARFFVQTITRHAGSDAVLIKLCASSRGAENKSWSQYTPSGTLELHVNNPGAAQWFSDRLGSDVALVFDDRPTVCPGCKEEISFVGEHQHIVTCPKCGASVE